MPPSVPPGTEPGKFSADRVAQGAGGAELSVMDMGVGWIDPSDTCNCRERFSTAVMVSNAAFGEGFYEARIKTTTETDFFAGTMLVCVCVWLYCWY